MVGKEGSFCAAFLLGPTREGKYEPSGGARESETSSLLLFSL
jgi:hypothetical protein